MSFLPKQLATFALLAGVLILVTLGVSCMRESADTPAPTPMSTRVSRPASDLTATSTPTEVRPTPVTTLTVPVPTDGTGSPTEPPPGSNRFLSVVLVADGQEQVGGLGDSCRWSEGGGLCADTFGVVPIPSEPIVLKPGQKVVFRSDIDLDLFSLTVLVFEAHDNMRNSFNWVGSIELSIEREDLDLGQEAMFHRQLEPGQYVLVVNGLWSQGDAGFEGSYGFNVIVMD